MRYDYKCNDCSTEKEWVVFEVSHSIHEQPEIICPACNKKNCEHIILTASKHWVRGNGWLDVKGRQRDLNRHTLANNDPYAHMRESGEADDLMVRLKNDGKDVRRGRTVKIYGGPKKEDYVAPKITIRRVN